MITPSLPTRPHRSASCHRSASIRRSTPLSCEIAWATAAPVRPGDQPVHDDRADLRIARDGGRELRAEDGQAGGLEHRPPDLRA